MRTKSKITDAEIIAKLEATDGNVNATAKELKVGKGRVFALNKLHRPHKKTEDAAKRNRSTFEAVEATVHHLCNVIETMTKRDIDTGHKVATMLGITVDKLLLMAGKPITIHQQQQTKTPTFDLGKLTRRELEEMLRLHDKINGVQLPIDVSDLENPVIYDDTAPDCTAPVPTEEG